MLLGCIGLYPSAKAILAFLHKTRESSVGETQLRYYFINMILLSFIASVVVTHRWIHPVKSVTSFTLCINEPA